MAAPKAVGYSFAKASETYVPPLSIAMGALGAIGVLVPIIKGLNDIRKTRFSKKKGGSKGGGSISQPSAGGGAASPITSGVTDISANNAARLGIDPSLGAGAAGIAAANVQGAASPSVTFSESKYNDFQNQVEFKEDKTTIG